MYKAGDRCSVVTVDHQGKELGSLFVGAEILDISACGKYLAVLTTEKLMILQVTQFCHCPIPSVYRAIRLVQYQCMS